MVLTLPSTYFRFDRHSRAAPARSPTLERFLACAELVTAVVDWRSEAQRLLAGSVTPIVQAAPAAFLVQLGSDASARDAVHVFLAAPLHARASLTSVSLPDSGVLTLSPGESAELAADFNERFAHGGVRLIASAMGQLFCVFDTALAVETREPELLQGYDLWDFQPAGPDAARLKKLGSEIEMWLFGHPVNLRRIRDGGLEITGLWLWGGERKLERLPPRWFEFTGHDVLFSAWSGMPPAPELLGRIVRCTAAPGQPMFEELGSIVFADAVRSLRDSRAEALYFSCGTRCLVVRRMPRWFFRRTRPWWEHFDDSDQ